MSTTLISARTAATLLGPAGLSREQARRVLSAGLAGTPQRTSSALLYDEQSVRELAQRPSTDQHLLRQLCPSGLFLARLGRTRPIDVTAPWPEQAECAGRDWYLSPWTVVLIRARMTRSAPMPAASFPFLGTVGGFVAFGGDITGFRADDSGLIRFLLNPPGPWFDTLRDYHHHSGPGRDWYLHAWPREDSR
jgi:hypothetical protein